MSHLTAHVLDAAAGVPAEGVRITLAAGDGIVLATAETDANGRVNELGPDRLESGEYAVTFGSGAYFAERGTRSFHPRITVLFTVDAAQQHYHIPLLLSPFAYTTYRGS